MKLVLLSVQPALSAAWRRAFDDVEDVYVYEGSFQSIIGSYDCLVSPANSFGLMDGGMDAARLAVVSRTYHQPNKGFLLLLIPQK